MKLAEAREAARHWMLEEARRIPGFCGAYTAGSANWLPDSADLDAGSDLDIMVVLTDHNQRRHKFIYQDTLLEVSYLRKDQLQSPEQILSDYHLAPSLRTTKVMFDPFGLLAPLLAVVVRDYAKRRWVAQRCAHAKDKMLAHLHSVHEQAALHDQVIACLFGAGIMTHVLLVAGLRNPTIRARYVTVRELLASYGHLEFHETLLQLLGTAAMPRARVSQHLATLAEIFDAATRIVKTQFEFASDIGETARTIAIDGSSELIESGYHREAMFWIGVTHSRCQKVLSLDAPSHLTQNYKDSYQDLLSDIGLPTIAKIRRRCADIERILPKLCDLAAGVIAANHEIEDDGYFALVR